MPRTSEGTALACASLQDFLPVVPAILVVGALVVQVGGLNPALDAALMVTPTLLKVSPHPPRRILGNLENREALPSLLRIEPPLFDPT